MIVEPPGQELLLEFRKWHGSWTAAKLKLLSAKDRGVLDGRVRMDETAAREDLSNRYNRLLLRIHVLDDSAQAIGMHFLGWTALPEPPALQGS